MLLFKKTAKRKLSPANIQLNLGKSPPQNEKSKSISPQKQIEYKGELKRSYSISPQKRREPSNKSYTSHDLREGINEYYTQIPLPYNKPKINLMKKIGMFTNNLKKTLFTKDKPVFLNLGQSPPRKNEQSPVQHNSLTNKYKNIKNSIGGKIIAKPSRKPNKQKK